MVPYGLAYLLARVLAAKHRRDCRGRTDHNQPASADGVGARVDAITWSCTSAHTATQPDTSASSRGWVTIILGRRCAELKGVTPFFNWRSRRARRKPDLEAGESGGSTECHRSAEVLLTPT